MRIEYYHLIKYGVKDWSDLVCSFTRVNYCRRPVLSINTDGLTKISEAILEDSKMPLDKFLLKNGGYMFGGVVIQKDDSIKDGFISICCDPMIPTIRSTVGKK